MKNLSKLLVVVMAMTFVFTGCGKYDEGPSLTLLTKKARITGEWKLVKILDETGSEIDLQDTEQTFTINKDNTYEVTFTMGTFSETSKGEWKWGDKKETIMSKGEDATEWSEAKILKLKNSELWTEDTDENPFQSQYEKQ